MVNEEKCKAHGWVYKCSQKPEPGTDRCFWHSDSKETLSKKTRERVEEAIKNEEKLEGAYFKNSSLSGVNFQGVKLVEAEFISADCHEVNFSRADLWRAKFIGESDKNQTNLIEAKFNSAQLLESEFRYANLDKADLEQARLKLASFKNVKMKGVKLHEAKFDQTTFEDVEWDDNKINIYEQQKNYQDAINIYGKLKQAYSNAGDFASAGEFFYREMECRRKGSEKFSQKFELTFLWLFWGYGEQPFRVFGVAAFIILFMGMIYYIFHGFIDSSANIVDSIYFSATSFTAVGYGGWVKEPRKWASLLGVIETFLGIIMVSVLTVTLVRKMFRS